MPQPAARVQQEVPPEIIFVRQQFSAFGGAELILDRILDALGQRGYKIALLARSWKSDREGTGFIRCDPPKVARSLRETLFARAACGALQKYPRSLVQAHERIPCCDIFRAGDGVHAAYLAARKSTKKVAENIFQSFSLFHRNILRLEQEMFASRRLKAVIAISKMVVTDITKHYDYPSEQIYHIPNGIDLTQFNLEIQTRFRSTVRESVGIGPDKPVVLFIGSGFDRKGLDLAISAVAQSKTDAELWVVGNDRNPGKFKFLAQKAGLSARYRYFGPQNDPRPWYGAADICVLPSLYEPFGSTVIEAMACGLPTVVSSNCGAKEMVEQFDQELICSRSDLHGFAKAVELALHKAQIYRNREIARSIAEKYSMENMIEKLLALYRKLGLRIQ